MSRKLFVTLILLVMLGTEYKDSVSICRYYMFLVKFSVFSGSPEMIDVLFIDLWLYLVYKPSLQC